MATHTDTNKLASYTSSNYPSLGDQKTYISNELSKIATSIGNIIAVMKLLEARMNANGLT